MLATSGRSVRHFALLRDVTRAHHNNVPPCVLVVWCDVVGTHAKSSPVGGCGFFFKGIDRIPQGDNFSYEEHPPNFTMRE